MAGITTADVHVFKSEVIADVPNGGGHMTGNEVIDGELNNLFDDSSRTDRVNGRVSLRKCFGAITTNTVAKFLGAHAIISRPPADERVSCLILDLKNPADQRSQAQAFVEQYLLASAETQLTLYGTQPLAARTIVAYMDVTARAPNIGDVLCLSVEDASQATNGTQQFVRVSSIATEDFVGVDGYGNYAKTLLSIGISDPLSVSFPGADIARQLALAAKPTRIRKADLNPLARYYGIVPLAQPIVAGDLELKVETILRPAVPSAYAESPLLDQQIGSGTGPLVASGPAYSEAFSTSASGGRLTVLLTRPCLPGSVEITCAAASGTNNALFAEGGAGTLTRTGGGANTAGATGFVASLAGQITINGLPDVGYTVTVVYTPAASVADVQNTSGTEITLSNRGYNYNQTLKPKPARGSVIVNYRSLGQWYQLTDAGDGTLVGAPGLGSGTVNYLTGTVNVTCGYQPDVGSHVLFGWGTGAHYTQAIYTGLVQASISGTLVIGTGLVPGSIDIAWTVGGTTYHATDSAVHGQLAGSGTGTIDYATGAFRLIPNALVPSGTVFSASASKRTPHSEVPSVSTSGGTKTFTLANTPVQADTIQVAAVYKSGTGSTVTAVFQSLGSAFRMLNGAFLDAPGLVYVAGDIGTVNHTTGACALPTTLVGGERYYSYNNTTGEWQTLTRDVNFDSLVSVDYVDAGGSPASVSASVTLSTIAFDLRRGLYTGFVAGSLMFGFGGRVYFESDGTLYYRDGSGSPVAAGSFDPTTGLGEISAWGSGSPTLTVYALLAKIGVWKLGSVIWRTTGSPLRPASFQVTDGTHFASADNTGTLTGGSTFINGSINIETGVYQVTFVPSVVPELARYNAVALTYLPIDPEVLGLNAVRLPLDGRVPVIQRSQDLVILNDEFVTLPNPAIAGTTYSLGRDALAYAVVRDSRGVKVLSSKFTADLDAGTITMANPLDLSAYTQPLIVETRIEDMVLCTDAQLNGDVQIAGYIAHDYPAEGTYVASAKLYGDLQARVGVLFSQQTWTGVWSDVLIGSTTSAQYDDINHPVIVTNAGAAEERWRFQFTNANSYQLFGETLGLVANGSTLTDFAPVNPATGEPYFTIAAAGWGSGWNAGQQLRLNTYACAAPIWLLRCTLQGPATEPTDSFVIQFRGDN